MTTDEKIYFYYIDTKEFTPKLENVMLNFMSCDQMMFGSKRKYCVTYKNNQNDFEVYTRQFQHDFKVMVNEERFDGGIGVELESMEAFLVGKGNTIRIFDNSSFVESKSSSIHLEMSKSQDRYPNEVIGMAKCHNERFLAVITGKNLIMNQ